MSILSRLNKLRNIPSEVTVSISEVQICVEMPMLQTPRITAFDSITLLLIVKMLDKIV